MKILITGLHGFVGSNLIQQLSIDHSIYGLDIVTPEKKGVVKNYLWSQLDKIHEVDAIIHLAGKAHDTKKQSKAQEYFDINTELTKKIYDYFLTSSAKRFIFFSSVKAAADFVPGEILTENITPSPKGPYGESKIAAENFLLSQEPRAKSQDKKVYILRPCMIHGPGNKGNLNLLYNVVKKGIPWPLGAFENRRSFTSIDNLSFVIEGLLNKDIPSGIYNMADDEAMSTNELIQTMCEAMNRPVRIWYISSKLMKRIAHIGSILHLPLNDERLQKLTENYVVSNAKIKKALGIEKMPISSKDGLLKTIASFEEGGSRPK